MKYPDLATYLFERLILCNHSSVKIYTFSMLHLVLKVNLVSYLILPSPSFLSDDNESQIKGCDINFFNRYYLSIAIYVMI